MKLVVMWNCSSSKLGQLPHTQVPPLQCGALAWGADTQPHDGARLTANARDADSPCSGLTAWHVASAQNILATIITFIIGS